LVRTKLAGPLSNLVLGGAVFGVWLLAVVSGTSNVYIGFLAVYAVTLNSMLGLFNMIPLEPFDGAAIMRFDRVLWAVTSVSLLALLVVVNVL
jgi:Zn-dependent protease